MKTGDRVLTADGTGYIVKRHKRVTIKGLGPLVELDAFEVELDGHEGSLPFSRDEIKVLECASESTD